MGQAIISKKFEELKALADSWLVEELARFELQPGLGDACSGSLLSPGKRLRPVLCLAVADALGIESEKLRAFVLALEFIHTSSLIHDDLPALDNDDFRRGEPTCHKKFGEGIALLAGDVLLVRAFGLLAEADVMVETRAEWGKLLSAASVKLCNGQTLDLRLAGKSGPPVEKPESDSKILETLCLMKTAALFRAAVVAPVYVLPRERWDGLVGTLSEFGDQLGLLFQITDDLLDSAEPEDAGSETEINYAQRYGVSAAEARADEALAAALEHLKPLGERAAFLRDLLQAVRTRTA